MVAVLYTDKIAAINNNINDITINIFNNMEILRPEELIFTTIVELFWKDRLSKLLKTGRVQPCISQHNSGMSDQAKESLTAVIIKSIDRTQTNE